MDTTILGIDVASRKLDFAWSSEQEGWQHATVDYDKQSLDDFLKSHQSIKAKLSLARWGWSQPVTTISRPASTSSNMASQSD